MALSSLLGAIGKPSSKALEAPIRAIVHEVLREQGYASPAEVQALRDEARELKSRVEGALSRVGELSKSVEAARSATPVAAPAAPAAPAEDPRVAGLQAQVASLTAQLEALAGELSALRAAPPAAAPAAVEAAAPLAAAPKSGCKVPDCAEHVRSKGFCSAHYQQWRRGTLKGFVGLEGTVEVGGKVVSLGSEHAGGRLEIDGSRVLVDGQVVLDLAAA